MTVYCVAGSQAEKKADNRLYVMKWGDMHKTVHEDDESDSEEERQAPVEPVIRFETVPHRGGVNRVRTMHNSSIVATWNEDCEVGIYNIG